MKQQLSKLFKPITKSDWVKFAVFILLNIIFCISLPWVRLFVVAIVDSYFPNHTIFGIHYTQSQAYIAVDLILLLFLQIWSGVFIRKLRIWLLSLPLQFVLGCLVLYLLYSDVIFSVKLIGHHILAQAIGVFIGLYVRKHRKRKQAHPAE